MTGATATKTTVVYVANTGHIVASMSKSNASGPTPTLADLVGDSLPLQMGLTNAPATPPAGLVNTFKIPVADLAPPVDVDSKTLGPTSWGKTMNVANSGSSGPILASQSPSALTNAFSNTTLTVIYKNSTQTATVTISAPPAVLDAPYYIIVAQPLAADGFPVKSNATVTSSSIALTLPNVQSGTSYLVLILVQNVMPYVAMFAVP